LILSYIAQVFVPFVVERTWLQIIFAIIMGFACAQVGLNPLHDASHFSGKLSHFYEVFLDPAVNLGVIAATEIQGFAYSPIAFGFLSSYSQPYRLEDLRRYA